MNTRRRLRNRRHSETFSFQCNGLKYTATASWFDDGTLGEVFLGNHRADSHADACARDSAILASISLQYDVSLDVLRKSLLRDAQGCPSTPIGCALDLLAEPVMSDTPLKPVMVPVIVGNACKGFLYRRRGQFEAYDINEKSVGIFGTEREAIAALFDPKSRVSS